MKNSMFVVLALAILSTPLVVLGVISILRTPEVQPQVDTQIVDQQPAPQQIIVTPATPQPAAPQPAAPTGQPVPPAAPSSSFMTGYWDGWHGVWLGPVRWVVSDDYRQGHMLGVYDRRHGISNRYPRPGK